MRIKNNKKLFKYIKKHGLINVIVYILKKNFTIRLLGRH